MCCWLCCTGMASQFLLKLNGIRHSEQRNDEVCAKLVRVIANLAASASVAPNVARAEGIDILITLLVQHTGAEGGAGEELLLATVFALSNIMCCRTDGNRIAAESFDGIRGA